MKTTDTLYLVAAGLAGLALWQLYRQTTAGRRPAVVGVTPEQAAENRRRLWDVELATSPGFWI